MPLIPFGIAIVAALAVLAWLSTDKVVYQGAATATWNNIKHYSRDSRAVSVVFNQSIAGKNIHEATVSREVEARIKRSVVAHPVQVTVKQRAFSQPRISELVA